MNLLLRFLINGLVIYTAGNVFSGVHVSSYLAALWVVVLLSIVNALIKPFIILLTLPITILTLGLFLFFINGAMVLLVSSLVEGFEVDSWGWAIILSIILSFFNLIMARGDQQKQSEG